MVMHLFGPLICVLFFEAASAGATTRTSSLSVSTEALSRQQICATDILNSSSISISKWIKSSDNGVTIDAVVTVALKDVDTSALSLKCLRKNTYVRKIFVICSKEVGKAVDAALKNVNMYPLLNHGIFIIDEKLRFPFQASGVLDALKVIPPYQCNDHQFSNKATTANTKSKRQHQHQAKTGLLSREREELYDHFKRAVSGKGKCVYPADDEMFVKRTGWYYQQLLKLYAGLVLPNITDSWLVADSDTLFFRPVHFFAPNKTALYNFEKTVCRPVERQISNLLPSLRLPELHAPTHHMVFQKDVIKAMFSAIEAHHSRTYKDSSPFWKLFLTSTDVLFNGRQTSGASEYMLYLSYIHTFVPLYERWNWRKLKFRNVAFNSPNKSSIYWDRMSDDLRRPNGDDGTYYVSLHAYLKEGE